MQAFKFDDVALEKISKCRQNENKIYIVFGYQFESDYYNSDELKNNISSKGCR